MPRPDRMTARISALTLLLAMLCMLSPARIISAAPPVADGSAAAEWSYTKPVESTDGAAYAEFYLDEQVYAAAAADLRDLRIADSSGKFIPFYIESLVETSEEQTTTYSSTLIHQAQKNGDTTFDYEVTPLAEHVDIQGNRVEFELPGEDFLLHVQLFGSYDGLAWEPVTNGDLYRAGGREQNSLELGGSYKFAYYRLVAEKNAASLPFPVMTLLQSSRLSGAEYFRRRQEAQFEIEEAERQTVITVHNPDRLRISALLLESGGSFARRFELYDGAGGRIPVTGSGELYRLDFKDTEIVSTTILPAEAASASTLRVVIHNQDDAPIPLTGIRLEYLVDRIVFAAGESGPYRLLYGNPEAAAPQYDIVQFKAYIAAEAKTPARLGAAASLQAPEPGAAPDPPARGRTGFNMVMIAVSLLLILLLARKLGRK
ncbi:hypothetical protein [Paenibacillus tengchongensis]|uniref:hypothetical protein n=1 Tax=Paenibacillus tengchongensis TaxID=2608684 RepID=UPI00124C9C7C|nr:hypothetical protein [Paenibacillus tengchongensis]